MAEKDEEKTIVPTGNKSNLRIKENDTIIRISLIADTIGRLGDLLVTSLSGIFISIGVLTVLLFIIGMTGLSQSATLGKNLFPIGLMVLGAVGISFNTLFKNPALGSQFSVSFNYLLKKVLNFNTRNTIKKVDKFRVSKDFPELVEQYNAGGRYYIVAFKVRGVVSRISFENDLAYFHEKNANALSKIERTTLWTSSVSVSKAKVSPKKLPDNATPAMIKRQEEIYDVAKNLEHNQQLETIIYLSNLAPRELLDHADLIENSLADGLSVGYQRLSAKECKKEIKNIYA